MCAHRTASGAPSSIRGACWPFQLAGTGGLRAIHADDEDERETPPAEPLLAKLLEVPGRDGLGTLIPVDEVLMYAREKAGLDPV